MFGAQQGNFNSFAPQPAQQGGLFGANKPAGGLFGAAQQPQQPQNAGGLFGGAPAANQFGGNAFGGQQQTQPFMQQPAQQTQGLFGQQGNNNNGGVFGGQQQQGQGLFGGAQQQPAQQGLFGGQQPQQGNGLFGGQQNNTMAGGLFGGQPQQQAQTTGVFGGAQQTGTGLFGGNQQQGTGLFGQTAPQQQTPMGGGMFGNTQQTQGAGLFGTATNNANTSFMGQPQQQQSPFGANPTTNAFGGNTSVFGGAQGQQQNTSIFVGQPQPQQQQQNTGGLFNTFAPNTQQQGGFQQAGNTGTNLFGNTTLGGPAGMTNNKLGGTSWGVPTNLTSPTTSVSVGTQVQPIKSKNSKLDAKHLVKCIAALDQFNGLSKEEIRINFIQSGGQQPAITQQPALQTATGFGAGSAFKPVGTTTGFAAQSSLPSFGGLSTTSIGGQGAFGQTQPAGQQSLFAKPAFGAPTATQGTSLFGQQQQPAQGTSLFGGATQPQQQTSLFGQPATTTPSLFGQQQQQTGFGQNPAQPAQQTTSLFGTQPAQTSLFGQPQQQQQTPSLFGQQQQQTGSLFGQTTQAPSLFGQQQQQQQQAPSLFGTQTAAGSLFGAQIASNASMFGASPSTTPAQTGSLFTPAQPAAPTPTPMGFFSQPPPTFAQLSNPLFQTQQGIDPSLQLLLPQLLINYALTQQASQPSIDPSNNAAADLINKLSSLVSQLNVNQSNNNTASAVSSNTPFDELMKESRADRLSLQKKESDHAYSLFSDFEKEPNYYLESASFPTQSYPKKREEPSFTIQNVHRVPKKQESLLGDKSLKQASRSYKASQEEGRKKINAVLADLPKVGSFSISPSLDRLKGYTQDQLRHVQGFRVWNQFGEVQFLEEVSLYRADLEAGVIISQDNIEITDSEFQDKRMRMTFRNFGNYANLKGEERDKVVKRMRKWIAKYDMREVSHDQHNGDLVVEVDSN